MQNTYLVSINGQIFKPEEAKISVFDRGFIYGDAVYEVARAYERVFFELEKHLERMFKSAEMIALDLQQSIENYIEDIYSVYEHVEDPNAYMRIQITRGQGPIGLATSNAKKPNVVIYMRKLDATPQEYYTRGVGIVTTLRQRNTKKALDPNIKSGNYLNNMLAFMDASKAKVYESVMVNASGLITEATVSNIFMVKGGEIISPPDEFDILKGITRGVVKNLCQEAGLKYVEKGFSPQELELADEVFLTSSTKEVLPVQHVNGKLVAGRNEGPGPLTRTLMLAYKDYVKKYCVSHQRS